MEVAEQFDETTLLEENKRHIVVKMNLVLHCQNEELTFKSTASGHLPHRLRNFV